MDSFEKNILTALIRLRIENYIYEIIKLTVVEKEDATLYIDMIAASKRSSNIVYFNKIYDADIKIVHVFKDIDNVFLRNMSKKDKRRMRRRLKYM